MFFGAVLDMRLAAEIEAQIVCKGCGIILQIVVFPEGLRKKLGYLGR